MVVIFESSAPAQPSNQLTMGYTSSEWSYQVRVPRSLSRPGEPRS